MNLQELRKSIIAESFNNSLEKGKRAVIGEIREWKDGKYQRTKDGWVPLRESKEKSNSKYQADQTYEWRGKEWDPKKKKNVPVTKKVKISYVKENGDVVGKFEGESKDYIIREPEKYLKKLTEVSNNSENKEQLSENLKTFLKRASKTVLTNRDNSPTEFPSNSLTDAVSKYSKLKGISTDEVNSLLREGVIKDGIQNKGGQQFYSFKFNPNKLASFSNKITDSGNVESKGSDSGDILSSKDGEGTLIDSEGVELNYRVYGDGGVKIENNNFRKDFKTKQEAINFLKQRGAKEISEGNSPITNPSVLEDYIYDNEKKIKANMKTYGFKSSDLPKIKNYYSMASVLGVDSRELKEADLEYIGSTIKELLSKSQESEEIEKSEDDPCWEGYEQIGMKEKGGKKVPNCVPLKKSEAVEILGLNDFSDFENLS